MVEPALETPDDRVSGCPSFLEGQDMRRTGYSLVELLVCLSLASVVVVAGAPALLIARDSARAVGAIDYVVAQLHGARIEALKRHANVAIRFEAEGDDYALAMYVDGNGNGVRGAEITSGVDMLLRPRERLREHFPGVSFGLEDLVIGVDSAEFLDPADPIRVGRSGMISFSPTGTSSAGTVYLRGQGRRQSAVRVLGATGRVRSLTYDFPSGRWQAR